MLRLAPEWERKIGYAGAYYRASGDWWRLISYAYLHGGLMHLAFNGMALSQLGPLVEQQIGSSRAFVVYTFTAVTAVFGFYLTGGQALVGASGSLFGLIGLGLSYNHFAGGQQARMMRGFYLQWAVYGVLFGLLAGAGLRIANSAHVGGLVGGLILGFLIERDLRQPDRFASVWKIRTLLCCSATLFALGLMAWKAFG
jgi:rhomboid protease GluP